MWFNFPGRMTSSVAGLRNEDGYLTGLRVGNTAVSLDFHRLRGITGGSQRPSVGSNLQNDDVRIRHVHSHWNMGTDVVSAFRTRLLRRLGDGGAGKRGAVPKFDHRYESIGSGYLVALDNARTSAADMPVSGTATWLGQFTGFVQFAGVDGDISRNTGDVEMTADFANAAMTVDMLSTGGRNFVLGATIQGNGFSGTTHP